MKKVGTTVNIYKNYLIKAGYSCVRFKKTQGDIIKLASLKIKKWKRTQGTSYRSL